MKVIPILSVLVNVLILRELFTLVGENKIYLTLSLSEPWELFAYNFQSWLLSSHIYLNQYSTKDTRRPLCRFPELSLQNFLFFSTLFHRLSLPPQTLFAISSTQWDNQTLFAFYLPDRQPGNCLYTVNWYNYWT